MVYLCIKTHTSAHSDSVTGYNISFYVSLAGCGLRLATDCVCVCAVCDALFFAIVISLL